MGKYHIRWTYHAQGDLDRLVAYICRENPHNAQKIFKAIRKQVDRLASFPRRDRIIPELKKIPLDFYRESILHPWRILYRILGKEVIIMGVFDGRRDLQSLLLQRAGGNLPIKQKEGS